MPKNLTTAAQATASNADDLQVSQDHSSSIPPTEEAFPLEIQEIILGYHDKDIAESKFIFTNNNISPISGSQCTLFAQNRQGRSHNPFFLDALLVNLLSHIDRGEVKSAQSIIQVFPELLFTKGTMKSGRTHNRFINYNPIELARYGHDVEMLKMMKPYAAKLEGGLEQFKSILTAADREDKRHKGYDFTAAYNEIEDSTQSADDVIEGTLDSKPRPVDKNLVKFKKDFESKDIVNVKSFNFWPLLTAHKVKNILKAKLEDSNRKHQYAEFVKLVAYIEKKIPSSYIPIIQSSQDNIPQLIKNAHENIKRELLELQQEEIEHTKDRSCTMM